VLGGVADGFRDAVYRIVGVAEPDCGQVHPPPGQVAVRALADLVAEAPAESCPGHTHMLGK
jgi:hypothetical protein